MRINGYFSFSDLQDVHCDVSIRFLSCLYKHVIVVFINRFCNRRLLKLMWQTDKKIKTLINGISERCSSVMIFFYHRTIFCNLSILYHKVYTYMSITVWKKKKMKVWLQKRENIVVVKRFTFSLYFPLHYMYYWNKLTLNWPLCKE